MDLCVVADNDGHRLAGDGVDVALVNQFLEHLSTRNFAAATRRAYAYDLLCFEAVLRRARAFGNGAVGDGRLRLAGVAGPAGSRRGGSSDRDRGRLAGVLRCGAGVHEPPGRGAARAV